MSFEGKRERERGESYLIFTVVIPSTEPTLCVLWGIEVLIHREIRNSLAANITSLFLGMMNEKKKKIRAIHSRVQA